jgi:hypothetical protein
MRERIRSGSILNPESTTLFPLPLVRFDLASILTRAQSTWHPENPASTAADASSADSDDGDARAGEAEEGVAWPVEGISGTVEEAEGAGGRPVLPPPSGAIVNEAGIMTDGERCRGVGATVHPSPQSPHIPPSLPS